MTFYPPNLAEGMDADDYAVLRKLMDNKELREGYNIHRKKIRLIQEFRRQHLPGQPLPQVTPRCLWMLTQIYAAGKRGGAQDMCDWCAACLLKEGYVLHQLPEKQWGLQKVPLP